MPRRAATDPATPPAAAVIGGGPAGLMAAETLAGAGIKVTVFVFKNNPPRSLSPAR